MNTNRLSPQTQQLITDNPALSSILSRTSIRQYSDLPIPPAQKQAILAAAMSAPSGVNAQPWEFILIDDPQILAQLADALPYAKMAAKAPMAIITCGNSKKFLPGQDSTLWQQDLAAASENILLAAHALGLGAVWTCLFPHTDRIEAARKILNIPANIIPFNLIPIGHPLATHAPINKWHPERIHHNAY